MPYQHLLLARDARAVVTLTLNRPDRHNAFNEDLIAELSTALGDLSADDKVRVLVLSAAGTSFSAGADLDWMRRMAEYDEVQNHADANALAAMLNRLDTLPIPVIARVQGTAIGGGAGMLCCCDVVLASRTASFAFSETRIGLIPATISPYVLRAIGTQYARRYFLTAERFDAATALHIGMVSGVVEPADLDARVADVTTSILRNGPVAVRAAKQLIRDVGSQPIDDAMVRLTGQRIAAIRASAEGREGIAAFFDKRSPNWTEDV